MRDSVPRDPGRDVTPDGTPHCKNVGSHARGPRRTKRNNPAEHNAAAENLGSQELGAGLRTTPTQQLTLVALPRLRWRLAPCWPALVLVLVLVLLMCLLLEVTTLELALRAPLAPAAAHDDVADAAALAPDAAHVRGRCPETFGSIAASANAQPPADRLHCNNVLADSSARTAVRTPSTDNAVADTAATARATPVVAGCSLDVHSTVQENDSGPREPFTPGDQVSERSANFAPRRFVQPLLTACRLWLLYPTPRSSPRALALPTARIWRCAKARVT